MIYKSGIEKKYVVIYLRIFISCHFRKSRTKRWIILHLVTQSNRVRIQNSWLTLRETSALTNLIAATTRYFSLLFVRYKTLSMTSLRRKLHLQWKWKMGHNLGYQLHRQNHEEQKITLSCTGAAKHRSIADHKYLIISQASRIFDSWILHLCSETCCQFDHHYLASMMIMHQLIGSSAFHRKSPQYFLSAID